MKQVFLLLLVMLAAVSAQTPADKPAARDKKFVNGQWFDGSGFRNRVFYSVNGSLTAKKPSGSFETVDLHNGFVVPAFADAHNHLPSSTKNFEWANRLDLAAGVFYVLNPNDVAEESNPLRAQLGKPDTIDMIFAHAGFTCTGGHPQPLYERLVDQKIYDYKKSELEGRAFYAIDSMADIDKKWPEFLATQPEFVKIYLLNSEAYRLNDPARKSQGLRPEFAAEIVRRAHAAGLRAGAHIEDAEDFHNALLARVDFMMHLPGYYQQKPHAVADYRISDDDIGLAKQSGVTIVTTAALLDAEKEPEMQKIQIENLRRLKEAGVNLVVGSDRQPGSGAVIEIQHLKEAGLFSNAELLRMWTDATPHAIFPKRKIGRLQPGYEANFLVLRENPLTNFDATKQIEMRVKAGVVLPEMR